MSDTRSRMIHVYDTCMLSGMSARTCADKAFTVDSGLPPQAPRCYDSDIFSITFANDTYSQFW